MEVTPTIRTCAEDGTAPKNALENTTSNSDLVSRLSSQSEAAVLAWFYAMARAGVDRLQILALLTAVQITRPDDWDRNAVRREHDCDYGQPWTRRITLKSALCFGCHLDRDVSAHHVIMVSNGGSNVPRNQVPLCFDCHHHLHAWLQ